MRFAAKKLVKTACQTTMSFAFTMVNGQWSIVKFTKMKSILSADIFYEDCSQTAIRITGARRSKSPRFKHYKNTTFSAI